VALATAADRVKPEAARQLDGVARLSIIAEVALISSMEGNTHRQASAVAHPYLTHAYTLSTAAAHPSLYDVTKSGLLHYGLYVNHTCATFEFTSIVFILRIFYSTENAATCDSLQLYKISMLQRLS